ncbi:MAG: NADH-quinone oxidoreductase subunit C [Caldimicrobium sp.]|nr:NADH-quinone oxidoreductase subunit C [Caldimicrobium sp.]MCX7874271.1 NADH-quinone oxidoreductase subunit C [Caldimicrobium sp.]
MLEKVKEKFNKFVLAFENRDLPCIVVKREGFLELMKFLKEEGFNHLIDLCGVDYLNYKPEKKPERFEVVYHLFNMNTKVLLRVKVPIPEEDCWQYSVVTLWKTANWFERECFDMFGIKFKGHPDLRRLLMPEDWEGYPLRKDYPLELPEEQEWKVYKELKARGSK